MALTQSEILSVLEMFNRSDWNEMQLQSGDLKLLISKSGPSRFASFNPAPAAPLPGPPADASPATAVVPAPSVAPVSPAATDEPVDARWIAVKAPMLGHFYATPSPGEPPFVKVGQTVSDDDTVAILEVMKLMNHVKAGTAGTIVRIEANNGDLVEYEQVLLYIDPA